MRSKRNDTCQSKDRAYENGLDKIVGIPTF